MPYDKVIYVESEGKDLAKITIQKFVSLSHLETGQIMIEPHHAYHRVSLRITIRYFTEKVHDFCRAIKLS